ncbi:MAG: bifunctional phosphopantothenoylcysteine decarboxylase/phosphopantothenate--cysteine ligase CoaBC [Nitrospirae bacterium]|nr:bifunctional phosphopantothenoylcysteine decarboxylase/phosphopantothenate--cysteine ligase CoaBC [Nitrospirota bacterium]
MTKGKHVILCVTGSIASYKAVDIARRLSDSGINVSVVMTDAARQFMSPLAFEAVTRNKVYTNLFDDPLSHVTLPQNADLFLVAPATANTIGKFASGIADEIVSAMFMAFEGTVLIAPAMNEKMFNNPVVQKNIKNLTATGVRFIGPDSGSLACGYEGKGRLADTGEIVEAVISALSPKDLKGKNIVVTAGPTVEAIDPVRFISNRSSGKMGYEIARAASRRGADVTLISGPSPLVPPFGVSFIKVESASEMEDAVSKKFIKCDSLVMAAAVSDFAPSAFSRKKIKKGGLDVLKLRRTPDILQSFGKKKGKKLIVGFAAETGKDIGSAKKKLMSKNLDMIALNDVTQEGAGFNSETNIVTIIDRNGGVSDHPKMKKIEIADIIIDRMLRLWEKGGKR